jgi:hypothetical protein
VLRLERERATVVQRSAEAARAVKELQATVAPHLGLIQSTGRTPLQVVGGLLQTMSALRHGNRMERAAIVGALIRAHDVDVNAVADVLDGSAPQAQQPAQFRDPRVDTLIAERERERQVRAEAQDRSADRELDEFEKELGPDNFLPELWEDMAVMLEAAERRGVALSYRAAYDRSLNLHPDLLDIVRQRKEAEEAQRGASPGKGPTSRAEAAAVSVKPSPAVRAPPPLRGKSLLAHVEAAYDKHAGNE